MRFKWCGWWWVVSWYSCGFSREVYHVKCPTCCGRLVVRAVVIFCRCAVSGAVDLWDVVDCVVGWLDLSLCPSGP
eukprot:8966582-Prorocentrum_lima.AAC.1